MHELQFEELKIQQMKSQVELQGEIAAAEAEKLVFEQCEADKTRCDQQETVLPRAHSQRVSKAESVVRQYVNHPVPSHLPETQPKQRPKETPMQQQLNPCVPQWLQSQLSSSQQYERQAYDYPLQRLMEAHDRQNIAFQQIVQQLQQSVMALTLPQLTIKAFKGDPIEYCDFIRSFEHLVEEKAPSPSTRAYYLIQYTSGPPQDLMKSCLSMNAEQAYTEARKLLKERYGQKYRTAAAHVQTLTEGPTIKSERGNAVLQFSIQLTSCTNTLNEIGSLEKLDHPDNLRKVINRLPFGM